MKTRHGCRGGYADFAWVVAPVMAPHPPAGTFSPF